LEETWLDHAIRNAVKATKLLLCCVNLKMKKNYKKECVFFEKNKTKQ